MKKLCCALLFAALCIPAAGALSARSAVVMDADTGAVLFEHNADERLPMASTTKIMTALVALGEGSLDRTYTVKPEYAAVEGTSMYLQAGETLTLRDTLYGLMLSSGNDAAVAIAGECGGYDAFMQKMNDKASSLGLTDTHFVNPNGLPADGHYTTARELAQITRIVIAGCGSSMHAGLVGEYYFEDIAGISTSVEQAAEFRYRNPIIEPNTLVIPISQSGETADTLAAVREAAGKGAVVAALCNVVGSTIAREAGRGIYLHAGPEISVASTKAFSSQVAVLLLFALLLGRNRRLNRSEGLELAREIESIPSLLRTVLKQAPRIKEIAGHYAEMEHFFYIGRGCLYPTALEGALKLKEISYLHAEGYHAAELKHGPIALLDERHPVVALANDIPGKEKMLGNIQECRARKSPVLAVATEGDAEVVQLTDDVIYVPRCSRFIAPLPTTVALQLFAYYIAVARGCEVDQPRNLAKSVTVE